MLSIKARGRPPVKTNTMGASLFNRQLGIASLTAFALACGGHGKINQPSSSDSDDSQDANGANLTAKTPPKEYYMGLLEKALRQAESSGGKTKLTEVASPSTVFLNFFGQTVQRGFNDGQSFLVCTGLATIPASSLSQSSQDAIVKKVKSFFDDAGVDINITDVKPTSGAYTTVVVGGAYEDLGCGKAVVSDASAAPLDRSNANASDIAFVFPGDRSESMQAVLIARSIAHTFGLENSDNSQDIMAVQVSESTKGFLAGRVIGSGAAQDAAGTLRHNLGLDGTDAIEGSSSTQVPGLVNLSGDLAKLPGLETISGTGKVIAGLKTQDIVNISSLVAQIRSVLPATLNTPALDRAITAIALADRAAGGSGAGKTDVGAVGGIFRNLLANPQALTTVGGALATIATMGAGGGVATALGAILGIFNKTQSTVPTTTTTTADQTPAPVLPDFAGLLGISSVNDFNKLLGPYLNGHIAVINGNFGGDAKNALISMTKVGYAQAFAAMLAQLPSTGTTSTTSP